MNPILQPLSGGFRLGVALRHAAYRRGWLKTRKLNRPVISVGNLTVGGTGKTPLVALIARILVKHGWNPAILTRGYGRHGGPELLVIEPANPRFADPREVGDEPALLARELPKVPIVICTNRHRAGLVAEREFQANVHILDDGFQYLALARDLDVVALDVTQETSDRALLPAGRMREPSSALKRSHVVVLTRSDIGEPEPIEKRVRRTNPNVEIFRCATKLSRLVNIQSGESFAIEQLTDSPVSAFCGIGNPPAFFADLRKWGFSIVREEVFRDHHIYTEGEIGTLSEKAVMAGASAILTTWKDAVKIAPNWKLRRPLFACDIRAEVREAGAFENTLLRTLEGTNKAC